MALNLFGGSNAPGLGSIGAGVLQGVAARRRSNERTVAAQRAAISPRCGDTSFVMALWHTPCVMTGLTGLLESQTAADNESNHDNDSD